MIVTRTRFTRTTNPIVHSGYGVIDVHRPVQDNEFASTLGLRLLASIAIAT